MRKLIILRPEPGASETLERAVALKMDALPIPLFEIVAVEWPVPDSGDFDALLLTSANAVRFGGAGLDDLRTLPAYCVGEATAVAAQRAGLTVAATGSSGVEGLVREIPGGLRAIHLCGTAHRAVPGVKSIAVYDSRAIDPPPSLSALRGGVAMVHSPRAGARLAELVVQRSGISIAAISQAAADACGAGWSQVASVRSPDDGALLALAAELCQDRPR